MADAKWFVIHTYSGYEEKVQSNIETVAKNRGFWGKEILEVAVPTKIVKKMKKDHATKKPVEVEEKVKIFTGYVFVKVATTIKKELNGSNKPITEEEAKFIESEKMHDVVAMDDEAWYIIRNTRGVTGFVGPNSKPQALAQDELVRLGLEEPEAVAEVKPIVAKVADDHDDDDEIFGIDDDDDDEIFDLDDEEEKIILDYEVGDEVEIIDGSFVGSKGQVISIDFEKKIVVVGIAMFGQETPTECGLDQVQKINY